MKLIHSIAIVALSSSLGACIVAPHNPVGYTNETAVATTPVNTTYVAPHYPSPAVGYYWAFNPLAGWGWRHSFHGWHHHHGHRHHGYHR